MFQYIGRILEQFAFQLKAKAIQNNPIVTQK